MSRNAKINPKAPPQRRCAWKPCNVLFFQTRRDKIYHTNKCAVYAWRARGRRPSRHEETT